jgi:hypothetical protein
MQIIAGLVISYKSGFIDHSILLHQGTVITENGNKRPDP